MYYSNNNGVYRSDPLDHEFGTNYTDNIGFVNDFLEDAWSAMEDSWDDFEF